MFLIKYYKIIQDIEIFSEIPKRAVILISKNLWKCFERQRMQSKVCITKTRLTKLKQKTKKINLRLKMLVGLLQPIYLRDVVGMSSKSSCATPCHFKKFFFRKPSRWKFLDVKLARFVARIAEPMENNRSTAAELDKKVLYYLKTSNQICRYIEPQKHTLLEIAKKPSQQCSCIADLR